MIAKGEPKRVLKYENERQRSAITSQPLAALTLLRKNGPRNGATPGDVDPGILCVHTTITAVKTARESPPHVLNKVATRSCAGCTWDPSLILYLYSDFEFLVAMKIMDYLKDNGPRKGSRKQRG